MTPVDRHVGIILLCGWLCGTGCAHSPPTPAKQPAPRPIALVYRERGCDGCSEAAAALLAQSRWQFDVRYVGPDETLPLSAATLATAAVYVQPGADGDVKNVFRRLKPHAGEIRAFVRGGGRYLGLCMGGYLAGATPGFKLLPGDADQFISLADASVKTDADTIVDVIWRGRPRRMFFQDGPYFVLYRDAPGTVVLAKYLNGNPAAVVVPYGQGKVAVCGPHPEADEAWYRAYKLVPPPDRQWGTDLGLDLIDEMMRG